MEIQQILIIMGVPTAVTGLFFWLLQRRIEKHSEERRQTELAAAAEAEAREKNRETHLMMIMKSTRAAVVLSEATARAVQRIPSAKCNGDMTKALEEAEKLQKEQKEFLLNLGVHSIYDNV